jgi:hypothetical protein
MPAGHEHVEPDATGFRGYVVEFYNIISDIVVQDGYQSVLNLKVTSCACTPITQYTHVHIPDPLRWCFR